MATVSPNRADNQGAKARAAALYNICWGIYAGLVGARFAAHQGARQAAASAVAGFAFLFFAVVGVGMFR